MPNPTPAPSTGPTATPKKKRGLLKKALLGVVAIFLGCVALCIDWPCIPAWVNWGMRLSSCPAGKPLVAAKLDAWSVRREVPFPVEVAAEGLYTQGPADSASRAPLGRFSPKLLLVDAKGATTEVKIEKRWKGAGRGHKMASVILPAVPDGDYKLRVVVDTPLGEVTAEADAPLYAPALVHLATDRPLYKPGQTMKFRAVALRMSDLSPLEGRPGRFQVTSPSGDTLLDEKVPAGAWGVSASDFPLASNAEVGGYTVRWTSGTATDAVTVRVEPFVLPRFEVTAKASQAWYKVGETPVFRGTVRYRSGAPVVDAAVRATVHVTSTTDEGWPAPTEWEEPLRLRTDREGAFTIRLSPVPADLRTQASLLLRLEATDAAGERIGGGTSVPLSATPIVAKVETELQDGLVPDFNNRVYVRVTTPDGQPLRGATVRVSPAWIDTDAGSTGVADEDAVVALQIDPKKPVSVLVPPRPVRARPVSEVTRVTRTSLDDLLSSDEVTLAERTLVDAWTPSLEPCAALVESGMDTRRVGVLTDASGRVQRVLTREAPVDRCLADRLAQQKGLAGAEHFYAMDYQVMAAEGSTLQVGVEGVPAVPDAVTEVLTTAKVAARACVLRHGRPDDFPSILRWRVAKGAKNVQISWTADRSASGAWSPLELACTTNTFSGLSLDEEADEGAEGVAFLSVDPGAGGGDGASAPATVKTAWELRVEARAGADEKAESLGSTAVILDPGAVPALRLRPESPVLLPGEEIRVKVLRGPDFYGTLPDKDTKIPLLQGSTKVAELRYDVEGKVIHGTMPTTVPGGTEALHGLFTVEWSGSRAILLVPRKADLSVAVTPDRPGYRPGETAHLAVKTRTGEAATEAAVSLFGVDEALAQLAPLLGPDDWGRVTVREKTSRSAFGLFDARALMTGAIRGRNAVLATLLRVSEIPTTPAEGESVTASGQVSPTPSVTLVENFYEVLADVRLRVATWETTAKEGETLTGRKMVDLWEDTLKDRKKKDLPYADAFGVPLHLWRLPPDLVALADPRTLVMDARHLPEDVENWMAVAAEEDE